MTWLEEKEHFFKKIKFKRLRTVPKKHIFNQFERKTHIYYRWEGRVRLNLKKPYLATSLTSNLHFLAKNEIFSQSSINRLTNRLLIFCIMSRKDRKKKREWSHKKRNWSHRKRKYQKKWNFFRRSRVENLSTGRWICTPMNSSGNDFVILGLFPPNVTNNITACHLLY